jgi:undecaprenol kinase
VRLRAGRRAHGLAAREELSACIAASRCSALAVAALLQVSLVWWAIGGLCIALVLAVEMVNAALEYLIDRLHPEIHEEIKHAKDAAAGAVLLANASARPASACLMILGWWLGR